MEDKKTFGNYMKAKRSEAGLTQKEFADRLFVTESAVSKWERGLSYPDITLISEICRNLNISERELLTATEDTQTRNQERLANRYLILINRFKIVQYFFYGLILLTCFIVNLAVDHKLSWFFIVLTSVVMAASLTLLPLLFKKKRGLITLIGFTISLTALLAVCALITGGDWFFITFISVIFGLSLVFTPFMMISAELPVPFGDQKTLIYLIINTILLFLLLLVADIYAQGGQYLTIFCPTAIICLIPIWGSVLTWRYARINRLLKIAISIALFNTLYYFLNGFVGMLLGKTYNFGFLFNFADWSESYASENFNAIVFFALFATAIIFAILGSVREKKSDKERM